MEPPRMEQPRAEPAPRFDAPRPERAAPMQQEPEPLTALPAFITAPVRAAAVDAETIAPEPVRSEAEGMDVGGFHLRPRRRRRGRPGNGVETADQSAEAGESETSDAPPRE